MHLTFDHNFGKCRLIDKILSLSDDCGNIIHKCHKDSPPNLIRMFLLYRVKLENCNCYQFQWHIALETSEFILQDMRPP